MISAIELNISALIAKVKKYKSIVPKKKRKYNETAKTDLDPIKGLISCLLPDLYIGSDCFINVLREYDGMKKKIYQ